MASGVARGRVCTTTPESRKMAAIQPWFIESFFDTAHLYYANEYMKDHIFELGETN